MADRDAVLPFAWTRPFGGAERSCRRPDRPRDLFIVADEMVLLHGFEKKTQKTPQRDIELALKRKQEIEQ